MILVSQAAASAPECDAQARGFLEDKLAFWQERLELRSWKLTLLLSPASDLKPKTLGNIHWDAENKTATIRVLMPSEYKLACPATLEDLEYTLVHELVHLEISSLPRSAASRGEEEHAVNRITNALLALARGRPAAGTADRQVDAKPGAR